MSYDISMYTSKPMTQEIQENLCVKFDARKTEHSVIIEKKNWQIIIGLTQRIEEEDIPEELLEYTLDGKFALGIVLQPIGASQIAFATLQKIVKYLSEELNGIGYDGQAGEVITHKNYRNITLKPKKEKRIDLLTLTWLFQNENFEKKEDYEKFMTLLRVNLKELIPRRYGNSEPPKFKLEEHGIEHFIDWAWDNRARFGRVIYPQKPFYTLDLPSPKTNYYNRMGFHPKELKIQVDARILSIEGWENQIRKTWLKISEFIQPIYSDVRIIKNYMDKRASLGVDNYTEAHPIQIGWKGIPDDLGKAVYIGEPYKTELQLKNNIFDTFDWRDDKVLNNKIIPKAYQMKRKRIKKDFEDWAFNRFQTFFAEKYPFEKPENYEIFEKSNFNQFMSKLGFDR